MNELIKIETRAIGSEQIQTVNARDLHQFLEVSSRFNDWIKNRITAFDFVENQDFVTLTKNLVGGGKQTEYYISTGMAKELSMVERNEKGKQARQYFIECERIAKSSFRPAATMAPSSLQDTVGALMLMGKFMTEVPGVKLGIAMAVALDSIHQVTGLPIEDFRRILPAATEPICSHNATQLGKIAGKSAQAMNQALFAHGFQQKNARNEWELTKAGEEWGEAMPFARRGHSGYQILWNPEVLDAVSLRLVSH